MWHKVTGEPCDMKKQRIDSKLDRKILLKESAKGLTQAQIARKYQVSPQAVNQQFKRIINQDAVELYDNQLPAISRLLLLPILVIQSTLPSAKRVVRYRVQLLAASASLIFPGFLRLRLISRSSRTGISRLYQSLKR